MSTWDEASGRAAEPRSGYPEKQPDDAEDAIDKSKGALDQETEDAARRSGYAGTGESEEVAEDA